MCQRRVNLLQGFCVMSTDDAMFSIFLYCSAHCNWPLDYLDCSLVFSSYLINNIFCEGENVHVCWGNLLSICWTICVFFSSLSIGRSRFTVRRSRPRLFHECWMNKGLWFVHLISSRECGLVSLGSASGVLWGAWVGCGICPLCMLRGMAAIAHGIFGTIS